MLLHPHVLHHSYIARRHDTIVKVMTLQYFIFEIHTYDLCMYIRNSAERRQKLASSSHSMHAAVILLCTSFDWRTWTSMYLHLIPRFGFHTLIYIYIYIVCVMYVFSKAIEGAAFLHVRHLGIYASRLSGVAICMRELIICPTHIHPAS